MTRPVGRSNPATVAPPAPPTASGTRRMPLYRRLPNVPGFGVDVTAGKIGGWLTAGVAGGLGAARHCQRGARADASRAARSPGAAPPRSAGAGAWWSAKGRRKIRRSQGAQRVARIVIDPLTRIEGHLRIEAQVDGGAISDAWSSGTMFRGLELVVRNRDPREAWYWLQRICSVCTVVHAMASVRAVEDALADRSARQRPSGAQPDRRRANGAGPRRPLLSSAGARLGRCRQRAQGRPGQDRANRQLAFRLGQVRGEPFQGRAEPRAKRWWRAAS